MSTITLKVRVSWWVRPYLSCVHMFAVLTGMTPDFKKVTCTVLRGVRVVVAK